jgi:hypothetical protein
VAIYHSNEALLNGWSKVYKYPHASNIHAKVSGMVSQIFLQILNLTNKSQRQTQIEQGNRNPGSQLPEGSRHDVNTIHTRVRTLPMVGTMFEYDTKRKVTRRLVYVGSLGLFPTNDSF